MASYSRTDARPKQTSVEKYELKKVTALHSTFSCEVKWAECSYSTLEDVQVIFEDAPEAVYDAMVEHNWRRKDRLRQGCLKRKTKGKLPPGYGFAYDLDSDIVYGVGAEDILVPYAPHASFWASKLDKVVITPKDD